MGTVSSWQQDGSFNHDRMCAREEGCLPIDPKTSTEKCSTARDTRLSGLVGYDLFDKSIYIIRETKDTHQ